jgi:exosortase A
MNTQALTVTSNKQPLIIWLGLLVSFVAWGAFSLDGLTTAIEIWSVSEIFQHCFFVVPGALYLIWQERQYLRQIPMRPAWQALPFIIGQIVLYVVGVAGDIQLFMHVATFSMLPTLIWLVIGNRAACHCIFPLMFMLFAIPVGEELVPWLQEVTADMAVYLLQLSGIPLFRSGLYIEIPGGKFLVAEACSGISFFIASVVIGNLYAYMNLVSPVRRVGFVLLSIIYPIVANAIRVYGIILTGYLTDMQHAVGADHLIYGWVFFAIVIVSLILLGELFRRGERARITPNYHDLPHKPQRPMILIAALVLVIAGGLWQQQVQQRISSPWAYQLTPLAHDNTFASGFSGAQLSTPWEPRYSHAATEEQVAQQHNGLAFISYQVSYDGTKGELVSFQNKLYQQERWTLVERQTVHLSSSQKIVVRKDEVSSVLGDKRAIYFAYWFDGRWYTSKTKVKLAQTFAAMLHQPTAMRLYAVNLPIAQNAAQRAEHEQLLAELFAHYNTATLALGNTQEVGY